MLAEYLDHFRMTFEMKCEDLDAEPLARRSVPPSTMSLLGLCGTWRRWSSHWFRRFIEGHMELPRLVQVPGGPRPGLQRRGRGRRASSPRPGPSWHPEVAHAREVYARYDDLGALVGPAGDQSELREIVVHMIEEYARHCGHADLLRERIDGRTGQ